MQTYGMPLLKRKGFPLALPPTAKVRLRSAGVEPIMAEATARRQGWAAELGLAAAFGTEGPASYREVLAALAKIRTSA